MIRSPWDGHERTLVRGVIGALVAFDVVVVAYLVAVRAASPISHPLAPAWLLVAGGRPWIAALMAAPALFAAVRFVSRPRAWVAGAIMLVSAGALNEALAVLYEGPMRAFFSSGGVLAGWMAGLLYAKCLGGEARQPRRAEALAEIGACAALAATYVGSISSKLLRQGFSWADATSLQGMIFSQQRLDRPWLLREYAALVGSHGWIALTLAALTLLAQGSMIFYPWSPRGRAISGSLVLAFHVNVMLLTPIVFSTPMILLVVLSYPWPRVEARLRGRASTSVPQPPDVPATEIAPRRATGTALGALAMVIGAVLVAWFSPLRLYTQRHHEGRFVSSPVARDVPPALVPPPPDVDALLDHLGPGDRLGSLRVTRLEPIVARELGIALEGAGGVSMRASIVRTGVRGVPAPLASDTYELFYDGLRGVDEAARDAALAALAERLRRTEHASPIPRGM